MAATQIAISTVMGLTGGVSSPPGLNEADLGADPLAAFGHWFDEALAAGVPADIMVLATVDSAGRPTSRAVLLKGIDQRGLRFFTNHASAKARHLATNPACALTFVWDLVGRQVRITGRAEKLNEDESAAYFSSRPKGSRLGAWASRQSEVIADREVLENRMAALEETYRDTDEIPLPPFWGGYVVRPDTVEFWQGRPDRLHDRLRYWRRSDGPWSIERLAP